MNDNFVPPPNFQAAPLPKELWIYPFFENENNGKSRKVRYAIGLQPRSAGWKRFIRQDSDKESGK